MKSRRRFRRLASLLRLMGGWRMSFRRARSLCSPCCRYSLHSPLHFISPLRFINFLRSLHSLHSLGFPLSPRSPRSRSSQSSLSLRCSPVPRSPHLSLAMLPARSTLANSAADDSNTLPARNSWNAKGKDDD